MRFNCRLAALLREAEQRERLASRYNEAPTTIYTRVTSFPRGGREELFSTDVGSSARTRSFNFRPACCKSYVSSPLNSAFDKSRYTRVAVSRAATRVSELHALIRLCPPLPPTPHSPLPRGVVFLSRLLGASISGENLPEMMDDGGEFGGERERERRRERERENAREGDLHGNLRFNGAQVD